MLNPPKNNVREEICENEKKKEKDNYLHKRYKEYRPKKYIVQRVKRDHKQNKFQCISL